MCEGCQKQDCGKCTQCRDMIKFGGPGKKKKHASIVIILTMVMDGVNSTLHDDITVYIGIKQMKTDTIQTQDIEDDILVHTLHIIVLTHSNI